MSQEFATPFYRSGLWRKTQSLYMNAVLDTSGHVLTEIGGEYYREGDDIPVPKSLVVPPGVCERCFAMGVLRPAKLVHHKQHLTPQNIGDLSVTTDPGNLMRLCQDCHAIEHSGKPEQRVEFADDGSILGPSAADDFRAQVMRATDDGWGSRNVYHERRGHATSQDPEA